jgi:hypothetical protein
MKYLLMFLLLVGSVQADEYSIIAIKNPIPHYSSAMSRVDVAWLYGMKTRFWDDGTKVTVFYLDRNSKVHKKFCKDVLGIDSARFDRMLQSNLNSGNAGSFRMANSQEDVIYRVSLIEGAIGYYDENTVIINGGGYVAKIRIID